MKLNSLHLKLILIIIYLVIISVGLYFLFSVIDIKDLMSYEFIRSNRDIIFKYKSENFLFLNIIFFIFSVLWILFLGFVFPLLIFSGFVFGKWWGTLIAVVAVSIGATLLYMLANFFLQDLIKEKLVPKFYKLKKLFDKNDIFYYGVFRFIGGGGVPFMIQNILPSLFDMPVKNYFIATFAGCLPSMFVSVALGSGIEAVIDKNEKLSFLVVLSSPEIYIPIIAFISILFAAFLIRKLYFKH